MDTAGDVVSGCKSVVQRERSLLSVPMYAAATVATAITVMISITAFIDSIIDATSVTTAIVPVNIAILPGVAELKRKCGQADGGHRHHAPQYEEQLQ